MIPIHRRRLSSSLLVLVLVVLSLLAMTPAPVAADEHAQIKVALIVGPVGEELTPTYIALADAAAAAAEAGGASVARAYSPDATPAKVLEAVEGASIVVYFGHGIGSPNPYGAADPAAINGWGLQGPNAVGSHADSWQDGTLAYYGEAWIAANAHPAPGWVMIYSNACYAPGASEGFDVAATPEQAQARVSGYARAPLDELGASAYFATDFYQGAASLVGSILAHPEWSYAQIYGADPNYAGDAVSAFPDGAVAGREVWLQHSPYFEGKTEYWYAFAGDPTLTPAGTLLSGAAPSLDAYDFGAATVLGPAYAAGAVDVSVPIVAAGPTQLPALRFEATWELLSPGPAPVLDLVDVPNGLGALPPVSALQAPNSGAAGARLVNGSLTGSVEVPAVRGTYRLWLALTNADGKLVDGTAATYDLSVDAPVAATYEVPPSARAERGAALSIPVTVRNSGALAWGSAATGNVYLVGSWDRGDEAPQVAARARVSLSSGEAATMTFNVVAPDGEGAYTFRVEIVTARTGSLFADGISPGLVSVDVAPSSAGAAGPTNGGR